MESSANDPAKSLPALTRSCPVCGAVEKDRDFLKKDSLRLVQCAGCGMVFVKEVGQTLADGSYYQAEAAPFYLSEEKLRGDYSPARYSREVRLLHRFVKTGAVLDVGCSTGGFLFQLNRRYPQCYQTFGTDVPSPAIDYAKSQGITILKDNFLESHERLTYHAITFWAVLEHLAAPGDFLRQAHRMLKPRGICIILVPNLDSLAVKILKEKYRYILPQHLNYFNAKSLRALVTSAGFEVVRIVTTHFNPAVIWKDRRHPTGFVADEERAKLLGRTNALKENRILAPLRLAYGLVERALGSAGLADNLVAIAEKKAPVKLPEPL